MGCGGGLGAYEGMRMSDFILTDKQRKRSNIQGTGIQYLPGHKDNFVDLCTDIIRKSKIENPGDRGRGPEVCCKHIGE